MLEEDATIQWTVEAKSFEDIKLALTKTLALISPKFDRDFILFSFAFEHTIVVVLLQKND